MRIYEIKYEMEDSGDGYGREYFTNKAIANMRISSLKREYRNLLKIEEQNTEDGFCPPEFLAGIDPDPTLTPVDFECTRAGVTDMLNRMRDNWFCGEVPTRADEIV